MTFLLNRRGVAGLIGATSAFLATGVAARARKPAMAPLTIWATGVDALDYQVSDQTVRVAVRVTHEARKLRIRLSNAFGTAPLDIASVYIGRRSDGANIIPGTNRPLTFNGRKTVSIPAGASELSDACDLSVASRQQLLISVAVKGTPPVVTGHLRPKDNSFLSKAGDFCAEESGTAFPDVVPHWFFVDAVIAEDTPNVGTICVIGDSITDSGSEPIGHYGGWLDVVLDRMAAQTSSTWPSLANVAIAGNQLAGQRHGSGPSAVSRMARDVLSRHGVHTLIIFEGINDIYEANIREDDLIQAYQQIVLQAKMAGLRVMAITLLPTKLAKYTEERETVRLNLNKFIRTNKLIDHVIDFESVMTQKHNVFALPPEYDSGDGLHPNSAGYSALAQAVPLERLKRTY